MRKQQVHTVKPQKASINLVPTPQGTFYRVSIFAKGAEIQVGENWLMNGQDFTQGAGMTMVYPVRATGGFKFLAGHSGTVELTTDPLPAEELASKNRIPLWLGVAAIIAALLVSWLFTLGNGTASAPERSTPIPQPLIVKFNEEGKSAVEAAAPVVQKPAEQAEQPALPTEEPADAPSPTPLPTPTAAATPIYTPTWHLEVVGYFNLDNIPAELLNYKADLDACGLEPAQHGLVILGGSAVDLSVADGFFQGTACNAVTKAGYYSGNGRFAYEGGIAFMRHNHDVYFVNGVKIVTRNDTNWIFVRRYLK